ncbi:MAG: outer membrane beta-barrel protein [Cytophagaceae bacterium]|nr:outer membrane beta-barrel protein [Cytophagaceae bacterium]
MKKLLLTLIGVLSGIIVFAQKSGEVSGTVLDEKSSALPFTTVMLLKASDSTLAKAVVSDSEGAFKIENAVFNHYFLKISMVGYEDFYSPKFYLNEQNGSFKLEPIKMAVQTNALKELSVTAKKPFIEQQIDKTVLNVENSIVASGSTALEVLEKAPGVVVDQQNESIKLKNKSGVMFMIDGKKNYLSEADLVQYLKNMSSDQIASIEIITNPSSKYDASGNSGIINIKLKKNQNYGTNGSFSSTLGTAFVPNSTGDLNRGSVNLNLNYRNKKWNLFGSTSGNRGSWYNENRLHRNVYYENTKSVFDQFSQRNGHGLGNSTKIGADYFLNKKTTIGVMSDINLWDGEMVGTGNTTIASTTGAETINSSLKQIIGMEMGRTNINSNFNIKHNINEKGQELTFDIDYSNFRNTDNQNFNTSYFDQKGNTTSTLFQQSHTPKYINIVAAKIDYVLPLKNQTKLEMGAKTGYVKTDNDFGFEYLQDAQWINDAGKSNHFIYEENINAAYVNLGKNWKKWGVQGGLRAEHTHSVGNSLTMNKVVPRDYLSLFPTMFINQNINKNNSMR